MQIFNQCYQFLQNGEIHLLRQWLQAHKELCRDPKYILLLAISAEGDHLRKWEEAITALQKQEANQDLLYAYQQAARWSQKGEDNIRHRNYLHKAVSLSQQLELPEQELEFQTLYVNRLLQDGYVEEAQQRMGDLLNKALFLGKNLLIIAQGTILCGMLMNKQRWKEAASLTISIEEASLQRENWIGFACARMMRATCWQNQEKQKAAIHLLFQTGNYLFTKGAVSALNLIKARLAELQLLMGEEAFQELQQ